MHETRKDERMARKLIPYNRFSARHQEAGASQDRQDEAIRAMAKAEKIEVDESITLADKGLSAFRGKNWQKGDLGKFLDLVEGKLIPAGTVLGIERVSRLSRMPWSEQVQLWKRILNLGVEIWTAEPHAKYTAENFDDLAVNTPLSIYMNLAHNESKQKSDMVKDALRRKRRKAEETGEPHGGKRPAWIRPVGRPHPKDPKRIIVERWEVIPERKAVILKLHELAQGGMGERKMLKFLPTIGIHYWDDGGRWTRGRIAHLLRSRALVGEWIPRASHYKCLADRPRTIVNYPPILTEEELSATQRALRGRHRKGGREGVHRINLWSHLLKDVQGRSLALNTPRATTGTHWSYLAPDGREYFIPYESFTGYVLSAIRGLKVEQIDGSCKRDEWAERIDALQAGVESKQLAIAELNRQLAELPTVRWPVSVVSLLADLGEGLKEAEEALREAKEAGNSSTRIETLIATQSILTYLQGISDPAEQLEVLARLKARLPLLIAGITVAVEKGPGRSQWVHIRVEYHGGHIDRYSMRRGNPSPPSADYSRAW